MLIHTQINIIIILSSIITINLNFNDVYVIIRKTSVRTDYVYTNIIVLYYTLLNADISSSFSAKSIIFDPCIPIIIIKLYKLDR